MNKGKSTNKVVQMKRIMKWGGILLGGLIGLAFLTGVVLYPIGMEKLTRSYPNIPVEAVNIPTNSDAIARGRQIAVDWSCTKCHGASLGGMLLIDDPILGTISASNLTSGDGGIANSYTDTDWIRAIRHGIKPNGRIAIFMDYSTMRDQDLGDLIAYLKQVPPVASDYPEPQFGSVLPIAPAMGLFVPNIIDPGAPRAADSAPIATIDTHLSNRKS